MISDIVSIDHKTNADLAYAYANQIRVRKISSARN